MFAEGRPELEKSHCKNEHEDDRIEFVIFKSLYKAIAFSKLKENIYVWAIYVIIIYVKKNENVRDSIYIEIYVSDLRFAKNYLNIIFNM